MFKCAKCTKHFHLARANKSTNPVTTDLNQTMFILHWKLYQKRHTIQPLVKSTGENKH